MISTIVLKYPAPSILAASSYDLEIDEKKFESIYTVNGRAEAAYIKHRINLIILKTKSLESFYLNLKAS